MFFRLFTVVYVCLFSFVTSSNNFDFVQLLSGPSWSVEVRSKSYSGREWSTATGNVTFSSAVGLKMTGKSFFLDGKKRADVNIDFEEGGQKGKISWSPAEDDEIEELENIKSEGPSVAEFDFFKASESNWVSEESCQYQSSSGRCSIIVNGKSGFTLIFNDPNQQVTHVLSFKKAQKSTNWFQNNSTIIVVVVMFAVRFFMRKPRRGLQNEVRQAAQAQAQQAHSTSQPEKKEQ
eukprot:c19631_g1_i2.p1 GENE.c19631_g1_i2~~c19631_g1_i2.p1  ORF type:complete len:234 (+),score=94.31 c19631_g1_i2:43-744(+)